MISRFRLYLLCPSGLQEDVGSIGAKIDEHLLKTKIAITSLASISPLGNQSSQVWDHYLNQDTFISQQMIGNQLQFAARLSAHDQSLISQLRQSDAKYKSLDPTVLYALLVSRQALQQAGWKKGDDFGINIGSSRGATHLFEEYHSEFITTGRTSTLASPTTTLGNISSWVAHDLKNNGPTISHSITCSTALHAILNAVAWMQAGMANKFLVGGSEASLTPFTLAQMNALKIYATQPDAYPCRAFDLTKKKNSMVLGEGAAVACLEIGEQENALAYIEGIGYATDDILHNISISDEAICFQKSMQMALKNTSPDQVDAIVMHAPGTLKGDSSEYKAIQKVFGDSVPLLTTNKWKIGHTFGASGMLNLELAVFMMQHNQFIPIPYLENKPQTSDLKKVMINAVGFGGNAVSILLSK